MTKVGATAAYLKKLFEICSKDKALSFKGPKYDEKTEEWHFYIKCSQCNVGYTLMECESDGGTRFPYSFGSFVKAHSHPITTVSANAVFKNAEDQPVFAPYPEGYKPLAEKNKDKPKPIKQLKPIFLLPLKSCDHHWVLFEGKYRCLRCLDTQKSIPEGFKPEPVIKPAPVQVVKDPEGRKFR